jgi:hypothetical protein
VRLRAAIPLLAVAAALLLPSGASAAVRTGQSPDCKRFCMSVKPHEGPEGSVFTFKGRGWRANRRVTATFGVYCPPGQACIAIAYIARMHTGPHGGFTFRLRAGQEQPGDEAAGIRAGGRLTFSQKRRDGRLVRRRPRYHVIVPGQQS